MEVKPHTTLAILCRYEILREGVISSLKRSENYKVTFIADQAEHFKNQLADSLPDITLWIECNSTQETISSVLMILKTFPLHKIILITNGFSANDNIQIFNSGIKGHLFISSNIADLEEAIRIVGKGGTWFCREFLHSVAKLSLTQKEGNNFTSRESEIIKMVCCGFTSREIGEKLFLSVKTVESHRFKIFQKANVKNSIELYNWAMKNHLFIINE